MTRGGSTNFSEAALTEDVRRLQGKERTARNIARDLLEDFDAMQTLNVGTENAAKEDFFDQK